MAKVGSGKAQVELDDVLPFDGFDAVLDPIHARALVIQADRRACIISLEVTSLRPDLLRELRATAAQEAGCDWESVWVCVTHTFSAPHARTIAHLSGPEEVERNARLVKAYVTAVRTAVRQAASGLKEACFGLARGLVDVNVNRDVETPGGWWLGADPTGFSQHEMSCLVARSADDNTPIAVLFSADVQSSVLDRSKTSDGRRLVSGDLAGRAAELVERQLPGSTALFVVGCAADQAPLFQAVTQEVTPTGEVVRHDVHETAYTHLDELGRRLGEELLAAVQVAHTMKLEHISASSHELVCPGQHRADFGGLRPLRSYEYLPDKPVATTVSLLVLGELVLVGVEPELSSALGHRIRQAAAGPMELFTMVNGGAKYLPDADAYDRITYEAMNSAFGRGSDEVLAQDLLASVAGARKGLHSS